MPNSQKSKTPQERIFLALDKIEAYRRNNPVTQQIFLMVRYGDTELANRSEEEQIAVARQWEIVNQKNNKLLAIEQRRIAKICKIQQERNVSGIIWETVKCGEKSLSFPAVHRLLEPTTDDRLLMAQYKSKIIEFAIEVGRANNLKFFKVNRTAKSWTLLEKATDIWSFSSLYTQAYLHLHDDEKQGASIDLILSKGAEDFDKDSLWFCTG